MSPRACLVWSVCVLSQLSSSPRSPLFTSCRAVLVAEVLARAAQERKGMRFKSRKQSASSAGGRTVHALRQARVEGLTLLVADNPAGYFGVQINNAGNRIQGKPYEAQVSRGGKIECLGHFLTAEEAALCVARTPEGQAAARRAAAAPPLTSEEAEDVVVVVLEAVEAKEAEEEAEDVQMEVVEVVAVMEPEVVVDEDGRSEGRPKRRRNI